MTARSDDLTNDDRPRASIEALFETHYESVMRYARRRTDQLADAEEIAAQTFVTAWRRLEDAPTSDASLYWLYGIARHVLANHRRGQARRVRLQAKLRELVRAPRRESSAVPEVLLAMEDLGRIDQEILRLAAWENLSHGQIGAVLGITPNAAAIRLHRARRRLRQALHGRTSPPAKDSRRTRTLFGYKGSESRRSPQEEAP